MNILNRDKFKDQIIKQRKTMSEEYQYFNTFRKEMNITRWEYNELGDNELTIFFEDESQSVISHERLVDYFDKSADKEDKDNFYVCKDMSGFKDYDIDGWADQLYRTEVEHIFWTHLKSKI